LIIGITVIGFSVLLSTTVFSPEIQNYFNRIEFDSEKWKNWQETENEPSLRWNMISDLRSDYDLIGMKISEVEKLLGKADNENRKFISYYLGMSGHGIDTGTLFLKIENDIVIEIKVWHG